MSSEANKAASKRFYEKNREKILAERREEFPLGKVKCRDCGQYFSKLAAIEGGWIKSGRYFCICGECAEE